MKRISIKSSPYIVLFTVLALAICCGKARAQGGLPTVNATICDTTRSENTLRLLYWNIQNGMWSDQGKNYNTFVQWVQDYDPDICVWCESTSIFYDGSTKTLPEEERYLPAGWDELAARYGHSYTALGGWRDNYPQVITSKYPIETLLKITDTDEEGMPVSHGAALQSVKAGDMEIYFVTLHLWPQQYGFNVETVDREQSKADHEGDYFRLHEIQYICGHTVNDPQYESQQNWLMLGDFNSVSILDNWHYNRPDDSPAYLTQSHILDNTSLIDVIASRFPGQFVASHINGNRIDYIYASESMYDRIDKAMTLTDDWTFGVKLEGLANFCYPSDHYPILVDFKVE